MEESRRDWKRQQRLRNTTRRIIILSIFFYYYFFFLVLGRKDQLEAHFNKMLCTKWSLTHLEMLPTLTSPLKAEAVVAQQSTVMP